MPLQPQKWPLPYHERMHGATKTAEKSDVLYTKSLLRDAKPTRAQQAKRISPRETHRLISATEQYFPRLVKRGHPHALDLGHPVDLPQVRLRHQAAA